MVLILAVSFLEGVRATGVPDEILGSLLLTPGVDVLARSAPDELSLGLEGFPWLLPAVALLGFLLGARTWRLVIPREQRRARVRLPRALPEVGPRWAWSLPAALVAFLVLSTEFTVGSGGASIQIDPAAHWWLAVPAAVVLFLLVGQPWRARRG